jgi:hypothetical protein
MGFLNMNVILSQTVAGPLSPSPQAPPGKVRRTVIPVCDRKTIFCKKHYRCCTGAAAMALRAACSRIIYDNTPARTGPFIAHFCEVPALLASPSISHCVTASSAMLLFSRRFSEAYTRRPLIGRLSSRVSSVVRLPSAEAVAPMEDCS